MDDRTKNFDLHEKDINGYICIYIYSRSYIWYQWIHIPYPDTRNPERIRVSSGTNLHRRQLKRQEYEGKAPVIAIEMTEDFVTDSVAYTIWLWLTVRHGKSPFLIGKPSINGPFSMAMLNNQRVIINHWLVVDLPL